MRVQKATFIIDLTKSIEELLAQCDKDTRYSIKKGTENHITTTIYENIIAIHLQDKQYKPSSMLIFKIENEKATLLATNTNSELKHLNGNSLAYWEMIKLAKAKGCKILDLGGVDMYPTESQERINKFKKGFGGELIIHDQEVNIIDYLKTRLKKFVKQ